MLKTGRIVVFAATDFEVAAFKDWATTHAPELKVVITGVGLLNAGFAIGQYLLREKPDFALQAGVAGIKADHFSSDQVFAVKSEIVADLGVMEGKVWKSIAHFKNPEMARHGLWQLDNPDPERWLLPGWQLADGYTVNQISHQPEMPYHPPAGKLAQLETMEGAALHHACLHTGTPFLQLRTASNVVGDRNKQQWRLAEAMATLNHALVQWFQQYTQLS